MLEILDLFDLFGGGSTPVILPAYRRIAHYVPSEFAGTSSVTPNMDKSIRYEGPMGGGRVIFVEGPGYIPGWTRPFWGYNYCGAGNYPGNPTSDTDRCCEAHDKCYAAHGFSSNDVSVLHPGKGIGPGQADCDRDLCDCVNDLGKPPTFDENLLQHGITLLFCHNMY
ncbi:MAG: hypothetical protein ABSC63_02815 [Candidatus Binataceae bacterium]|jgi:hypothetical protein